MLEMLIMYGINIVAIILTVYIFELSKAITSTIQGDTTPKKYGMLTLNVFKYFEPIGFMLFFFFGYGWGKPAPVSSSSYKDRKTGTIITHLTPIVVALVIAELLALFYGWFAGNYYLSTFTTAVYTYMIRIAVFNLIPIAPMCGSEILKCFLTPNAAFRYGQNMAMIQMMFLFLWFFGILTPFLDAVTGIVTNIL